MPPTPTTEPTRLHAGDSAAWRREDLTDFPASAGWVLSYRLISAAASYGITANASGDAFAVTVNASTTATWAAGEYQWAASVALGAERYTVATGRLTVLPNLAAVTGGLDTRGPARKALDAVNATLASYGAKAYLQELEINGRRQRFVSPADFMAFRSRLIREAAAEEAASGVRPARQNRLLVRLTR